MKKIIKTDAQWRKKLSDLAYRVTRKSATEPRRSHEKFPKISGIFTCICCDANLFNSDSKFDSGTGWPSFYQPINNKAISEKSDYKFFMRRTEVLCSRCDAHLGHVFTDGPKPTGLRYCINGVALKFNPT